MAAHDVPWSRADDQLRQTYEAVDWAATSLGPMTSWHVELRTAVRTLVQSKFPMTLFWGPEGTLVYNQAFTEILGDKHPSALGRPAHEVFPEAWHIVEPLLGNILDGHPSVRFEDEPVPLIRHGFLEECFFTFSYSPVVNERGEVEGALDIATETTAQVVARRRQDLLAQLTERLASVDEIAELGSATCDVMGAYPSDLPVANVHLPGVPPLSTDPNTWLPARPPRPVAARRLVTDISDGCRTVWLPLPALRSDGHDVPREGDHRDLRSVAPMLVVRTVDHRPLDRSYRLFLRMVADTVAHAVDRLATRAAERALHEQERRFSTALQRSLLTAPMEPDHLEVTVRYEPATELAQIGGDWHDAFLLPGGSLVLAIGDVAGHDRDAAAAMAQVRNLLRGIAYSLDDSPAVVLGALDRAMKGLQVDTIATVLVARVEQTPAERARGVRTLRWSSAGHPPPALVRADGRVELLGWKQDMLLGVDPGAPRSDHTCELQPEDTVVFYTDGLVERRGHDFDHGIEWLLDVLEQHGHRSIEELADLLLANMLPGAADDVAILIMRAHPQD